MLKVKRVNRFDSVCLDLCTTYYISSYAIHITKINNSRNCKSRQAVLTVGVSHKTTPRKATVWVVKEK